MTDEPHRQPGEVAVLRYITIDGRVDASWACRVVEDSEDLLALFIPEGTTYIEDDEQRAEARWPCDTLRLMYPGRGHSISLTWGEAEGERTFLGYHVALEEPFRRSAVGFDTNPLTLALAVTPDHEWVWQDDDYLEERVAQGIYSPGLAAAIWSEGEAAVDAIESAQPPFSGDWSEWAPPVDWTLPALPEGWADAPLTHWPLAAWAYLDTRAP